MHHISIMRPLSLKFPCLCRLCRATKLTCSKTRSQQNKLTVVIHYSITSQPLFPEKPHQLINRHSREAVSISARGRHQCIILFTEFHCIFTDNEVHYHFHCIKASLIMIQPNFLALCQRSCFRCVAW